MHGMFYEREQARLLQRCPSTRPHRAECRQALKMSKFEGPAAFTSRHLGDEPTRRTNATCITTLDGIALRSSSPLSVTKDIQRVVERSPSARPKQPSVIYTPSIYNVHINHTKKQKEAVSKFYYRV